MKRVGPWLHIVACLSGRVSGTAQSIRKSATHASSVRGNPASNGVTHASSISRVEWQTMRTILVSWSDSTLGQYHEQTWHAGLARAPGVCALTGAPVRCHFPAVRTRTCYADARPQHDSRRHDEQNEQKVAR